MRNWNNAVGISNEAVSALPDYLWGIETFFKVTPGYFCDELPDYLWGIETRATAVDTDTEIASRLPMRNWNRYALLLGSVSCWLPDYLWGIETLRADQVDTRGFWWLPDYLWGIETLGAHHAALPRRLRFQTTYEELKPTFNSFGGNSKSASRLPMRNWNWDSRATTATIPQLPDYLWGIETAALSRVAAFSRFQTTYEELKLQTFAASLSGNFFASRLPMRNWNKSYCSRRQTAGLLPDYLWGIETFLWHKRKQGRYFSLPDYLWGIETMHFHLFAYFLYELPDYLWGIETDVVNVFEPETIGFQTTYEELKPPFQTTNASLQPLPDYLWGIETDLNNVVLVELRLPDYLWGIETASGRDRADGERRLPDYLWGIETRVPAPSRCIGDYASRLPMRNWNSGRPFWSS